MKTPQIFIFILTLLNTSCGIGQNTISTCDTLVLDKHTQNVLKVREKNIQEYLLARTKTSPELISNRNNLQLLDTWICNNSQVLIYDTINLQTIEINIKKGNKQFDPNNFLKPRDKGDLFTHPQLYDDNNSPFGFIESDTVVNFIEDFEIRIEGITIEIPKEAYSDLLSPNFCYTELSIKPIQSFTTPKQDKVFVYIFGELRVDENHSRQYAYQYSYMAKLIIDIKKGYQSRVVLRGDKLCFYNWNNCPEFVGF